MFTHKNQSWLFAGYELFAEKGPEGLKIEVLAQKVGISKSSFYHHFADLELFTDLLLKYHLDQAKRMAAKEEQCRNIDPELIHVLIAHKTDLLFNRQLRINRQNPLFASALEQSNFVVGGAFVEVWVKDLGLRLSVSQVEAMFELALENFYLQINAQNLHYEWLSDYFKNLRNIAVRLDLQENPEIVR
jgi:AcrR family transcriptional regulator